MESKIIKGDLIELAFEGKFDVIAHGCNCFCTMGAGIAPQMAKAFGCNTFKLEEDKYKGDINKLGQIEALLRFIDDVGIEGVIVVNAYTQYGFGKNHPNGLEKPLDYEALTLCFRKINNLFKGMILGLPYMIGCGLAGGDINTVKAIIEKECKDLKEIIYCDVN